MSFSENTRRFQFNSTQDCLYMRPFVRSFVRPSICWHVLCVPQSKRPSYTNECSKSTYEQHVLRRHTKGFGELLKRHAQTMDINDDNFYPKTILYIQCQTSSLYSYVRKIHIPAVLFWSLRQDSERATSERCWNNNAAVLVSMLLLLLLLQLLLPLFVVC